MDDSSFIPEPVKSESVTLNGSTIYYEVYGKGEPLFLLHGFTWSSKAWIPYISEYAGDYEIYLVDLKGHGKSGPFTEKLSLKTVASEIDALVDYLNLTGIKAIGYSYGGETLMQLALLNPGLINSMVIIGSCGSWDADDYPEFLEHLTYENLDQLHWMPEHQASDNQIRSILEQLPKYKVFLKDDDLKSIHAKTLFVIGDQDTGTSFDCILNALKHIANSYLWIVPNTGHRAHMGNNKADFIRISKEFLRGDWA